MKKTIDSFKHSVKTWIHSMIQDIVAQTIESDSFNEGKKISQTKKKKK